MTDTKTNETATPQRATRPETNGLAAAAGEQATRVEETSLLDTSTEDDAVVTNDHIDVDDPYAELEARRGEFRREPFGEPRLKLQAPARAGYRRYWFNDDIPGRIERALKAGYSFVKVNGENKRSVVGRAKTGGAQIAYLMEIPQDWFIQDVRLAQQKVDEIDAAIKGGNINEKGGTATNGDNRYVPKEGISYEPRRAARDD